MLMPPVSRYMTPNPSVVAPRDSISTARTRMNDGNVHHLPVLDGDKLVGLVSDHDLLAIHISEDRVADAMTCHVAEVPEATPLDEVIALMDDKQLGSVVITGKAGVQGIFTLTDAMRAFCDVLRREEEGQ